LRFFEYGLGRGRGYYLLAAIGIVGIIAAWWLIGAPTEARGLQKPLPEWFASELRFFRNYALAWGYGYYFLAGTGIIAPIVAWVLSGAQGAPPATTQPAPNIAPGTTQQSANSPPRASLWATVGLWSAIAAGATGMNSLLLAGSRYERGWEAHDYLYLAGIDYQVDQKLDEKFLRDALRTAHEIWAQKQRPQAASASATRAPG
jgi:hypothetical protein